jgi:hypothetical protein
MNNIIIESESLIVEIERPGSSYKGTRFDWTGFIKQVTLKGRGHTFCTVESHLPGKGTGGVGLCNEFGNTHPIGYDNAGSGQHFPKIGVGLLTRTSEEAYNFFAAYPVSPFIVHTDTTPDSVYFVSEPKMCRGYAIRLEKKISVRDRELSISYTMHNVGTESIVTNEYVHNFIAINDKPIGPDYILRFPNIIKPISEISESKGKALRLNNKEIHWGEPVSNTFYCQFYGFKNPTPFYWELIHNKEMVGVRERGSAPASSLALWGESHVVSPEVFVDISINPGETQQWNRIFEFFTTD